MSNLCQPMKWPKPYQIKENDQKDFVFWVLYQANGLAKVLAFSELYGAAYE